MLFCRFVIGFMFLALAGVSLKSQQSGVRFVQNNTNSNSSAYAVLYYNRNKLERSKLNAVFNDRKLAGWEPVISDFENPPANTPKPDLSRHIEDAWALYYMGRFIASGIDTPTPNDLHGALEKAGIPNKIVTLKRFLLQNPNNLDARLELMKELDRHARVRTIRTLGVTARNAQDTSPSTSTIAPEIKEELSPEDDANIWGELATMLNTALNTNDWLSVVPDVYFNIMDNMALYSPGMKALYKRNIPRVEKALEERQTDFSLWRMWQQMAQVTGRRILDFFPQIPSLPRESAWAWPPVQVVGWVREEARATQNWSKIIEYDWPYWPGSQLTMNDFAPVNRMPELTSVLASRRDRYWNQNLKPLLEACLHNKDFDKATEIYFDIASRPVFERETKLAFDMAKAHNYTFPPVQRQDRTESGAEQQSFIGDPVAGNVIRITPRNDSLKNLAMSGFLRLLVIDPSETFNMAEASRILGQGKLPDYTFYSSFITKPDQPVALELTEKEELPNNNFFWGILDDNVKYHHGGNAPPTYDSIMELLGAMHKKSRLEICREFVKENPGSIAAKGILLDQLRLTNPIRAFYAKKDANGQLDGYTDYEIWGEFINIVNSIFPQILIRPDDIYPQNPFRIQEINRSQLLKQFATRYIGSIENALQNRPHSKELWELWGTFAPYAPNRSLQSFMSTLTPVPDLPNFPPVFLYPNLIRSYQSLEAWRPIIELVEPIWKSYGDMIEANENIKHRLTKDLLEQYIAPLCEAYNKLGQDQKAEKIRSDWKKAEGWSKS